MSAGESPGGEPSGTSVPTRLLFKKPPSPYQPDLPSVVHVPDFFVNCKQADQEASLKSTFVFMWSPGSGEKPMEPQVAEEPIIGKQPANPRTGIFGSRQLFSPVDDFESC